MGGIAFPNGFGVTLRPHKIQYPIKWKTPAKIFVNSMSDLFHLEIPDDYLRQIWDTMLVADWHVYQVLAYQVCASDPSRPPKGGFVNITSNFSGAVLNSPPYDSLLVSVLPCQMLGWSIPCRTKFARAMGYIRFSFSRPCHG